MRDSPARLTPPHRSRSERADASSDASALRRCWLDREFVGIWSDRTVRIDAEDTATVTRLEALFAINVKAKQTTQCRYAHAAQLGMLRRSIEKRTIALDETDLSIGRFDEGERIFLLVKIAK